MKGPAYTQPGPGRDTPAENCLPYRFRRAERGDLDALTALENRCFTSDRISRRSFRRFIDAIGDRLILAERDGLLAGYALVLMRRATRLARLYSIAVSPGEQGLGLGEALVRQAEAAGRECGRIFMRLEVRPDNAGAIRLYQRLGYRRFGILPDYYEDHQQALRFQKRILFLAPEQDRLQVPYYAQSTDFTCGPAALMMAMAALRQGQPLGTREELQIWREATTIYMLSGHGGCGPHGLALAAWRRGFRTELWVNRAGPLFLDTVRAESKKQVLRQVHEDFMEQLADTDIRLHQATLPLHALEQAMAEGQVPVMLISTWQLNRSRVPHWVTLCAMDSQFVYLHDPEIDEGAGESVTDKQYLPVDRELFERMARYGGQAPLQAVVLVQARD